MTTPELDTPVEEPRAQLARALAFARRALRQWPAILGMLLAGAIGYAVFTHFRPPLYRSEAVVVYSEAVRLGDDPAHPANARSVTLRVQEMLTARQVLQRIVEEFDLYPDIRKKYGMLDAVDELKKHVVLKAPGGGTFTVAFEGRSAVEAQSVTAELVDLLIARDFSLRQSEARASAEFLGGEKKRAEKQLGKAEQSLAEFMTEHPRFALDATPLATGAAIRASVAVDDRARGRARPSGAVLRPRPTSAARTDAPSVEMPPAATAPDPELARQSAATRARAEAAVAAARTDLAEKQLRFTNAHPDVRAARDTLAQTEARLASLGPRTPAVDVVARREPVAETPKPVRQERYAQPARPAPAEAAPDLVELETDWSRLTRAVTEARQRQDQVEVALFKAEIAASSVSDASGTQMTVIDPAFLPLRPVPPGLKTIAVGFGALGLLLGTLLALALAAVDDRIYDRHSASGLGYVLFEVPRPRRRRRA